MSSYAGEIISGIEAKIVALLPLFKPSPYYYAVGKNNTKTNSKNYRVYPEEGNFAEGTLRTMAKAQQFTISLTTDYVEKDDHDKAIREAVELLNSAHEKLQVAGMINNFTINRVMSVTTFSFSSPDIDTDNKTVSLNTTFTINYRMG